MKLSLPNHIFDALPQAYLVGGAVRDLILGKKPLDYDMAVPSSPHKFAQIMANRLNGKVIVLGKDSFNVYRVVSESLSIDITGLKNNNIDADLNARDFTINALAYDLRKKQIIDCAGGLKDLQNRRVTMASRNAFQDDPLRLIRAFRMAATMGFAIAPLTFQAIAHEAGAICKSANERIWTELRLILACPASHATIQDMARTKLLFFMVPELRALQNCGQNRFHMNDVFTHTLDAYGALETHLRDPDIEYPPAAAHFIQNMAKNRQALLKMAILLHDIGKPASRRVDERGEIHFYGHAGKSAQLSKIICKRLRMSNQQHDWVERIVRYHQRPLALFLSQQGRQSLRNKGIGRFFRQCDQHTPYILIHAIADNLGKGDLHSQRNNRMVGFLKKLLVTYLDTISTLKAVPLINGNDLVRRFNLQPSPLVGKLLQNIEELHLAGRLKSREQALGWVTNYLDKTKKRP
jgi:poly(A) polymerase